MRVAGIGVGIPSLEVDNEGVLDRIAERSPELDGTGLQAVRSAATRLMESCGSETRFYRDKARGESARGLTHKAVTDALSAAGLGASEVDLLIYCGVSRALVEPGNAYLIAAEHGMECDAFDISDACMGWMRAVQVAQDSMVAGRYRNALVVTAEFGIDELFESCFRVRGPLDLRTRFTGYTLGEAATATVVSAEDEPWYFKYRSRPELADLCFFALPGFESFVADTGHFRGARPLELNAHSAALFEAAEVEMGRLLQEVVPDLDGPDLYIPHAASSTAYRNAALRAGMPDERLFCDVLPRYGNVVSGSLPLGLYLAQARGRLRDGADVVLCPASAGVCVAVARLRWRATGLGGADVAG